MRKTATASMQTFRLQVAVPEEKVAPGAPAHHEDYAVAHAPTPAGTVLPCTAPQVSRSPYPTQAPSSSDPSPMPDVSSASPSPPPVLSSALLFPQETDPVQENQEVALAISGVVDD